MDRKGTTGHYPYSRWIASIVLRASEMIRSRSKLYSHHFCSISWRIPLGSSFGLAGLRWDGGHRKDCQKCLSRQYSCIGSAAMNLLLSIQYWSLGGCSMPWVRFVSRLPKEFVTPWTLSFRNAVGKENPSKMSLSPCRFIGFGSSMLVNLPYFSVLIVMFFHEQLTLS